MKKCDTLRTFIKSGYEISTSFLTPPVCPNEINPIIASLIPQNWFDGKRVAKGLKQIEGKIESVNFGTEGSPVLYLQIPQYGCTCQRKCPKLTNKQAKKWANTVMNVGKTMMKADEVSYDPSKRRVRLWWD